MTYHINYAYTCHAGKVRQNNEDNFWCCGEILPAKNDGVEGIRTGVCLRESFPVMAVFDGMGGESQGEMAAYLACKELGKFYQSYRKNLKKQPEQFLEDACMAMNEAVCRYGQENRIRAMGTTVAMITFGKKNLYICNLGDSRIYEIEAGKLKQISRDHVLGGFHYGKAPLTQFLGVPEEEMRLEPATAVFDYQDKKRYLLCSDGVTDMLSDAEIEEILGKDQQVQAAAAELLDRILEKGARDNTTMILCEVEKDTNPLKTWLLQKKK